MSRGLDFGSWVSQPKQQSRSKSRGHDQAWRKNAGSDNYCSQKGIDIHRYCPGIRHKLHSHEFSTQPRHDRAVRNFNRTCLSSCAPTHYIDMCKQVCRLQWLEDTVRVVPARSSKKQAPAVVPFLLFFPVAKTNTPRCNRSHDRRVFQKFYSYKQIKGILQMR